MIVINDGSIFQTNDFKFYSKSKNNILPKQGPLKYGKNDNTYFIAIT